MNRPIDPCSPDPCPEPTPIAPLIEQRHQGIYLEGGILSSSMIMVNYVSPTGNNPTTNKNHIGLWQRVNDQVDSLIKLQPITSTTSDGNIFIENVNIEAVDYIVGYAIGNDSNLSKAVSTLSFGANLPLNTKGIPNPTLIEILETKKNLLYFQLNTPNGEPPFNNEHQLMIKYENTFNPPQNLAMPDSSQNFYKSLEDFTKIEPQNIVELDNQLFIIKNYPTRQHEWYTMAYITITDSLDTNIVATTTFKVNIADD